MGYGLLRTFIVKILNGFKSYSTGGPVSVVFKVRLILYFCISKFVVRYFEPAAQKLRDLSRFSPPLSCHIDKLFAE